ncbi:MAG: secretin N-terminal domain-containing protein [Verrucomicrobiota bacterium]
MKTIHSLLFFLLFTSLVVAQTTTPGGRAAEPSATNAPVLRRPIPTRNVNTNNTNFPRNFRSAVTNSAATPATAAPVVPTVPALPNLPAPTNAPSPTNTVLSTPVAPAPVPFVSVARTNAAGEVANISYNLVMPLEQLLDKIYAKLVGKTLLRAPTLPVTQPITLKTEGDLTHTEAVTALETILGMNGITVIPIGEKFIKVTLEANAGQQGGKFTEQDGGQLREAGEYVTQIVQLNYAQLAEVQAAITPFAKTPASIIAVPTSNTLILRDYSENVKRMLEIIKKIDIVARVEIKPEIIPIKYALAADIAQVLGSLTASGPGLSVGRNTSRGINTTANGYQPGGVGVTGGLNGAQPNANPGSTLGSAGNNRRNNFQNNLNNIVNQIASGGGQNQILGEAKIIADERTNSLLIFASDSDMVMIKTIIAQLDVVLAQVLIEAIIMEVSLGDTKQLGISYLQQPKKSGNFIGAGGVNNGQAFLDPRNFLGGTTNGGTGNPVQIQNLPGGFSYFGALGNDLDIAVTAFANDSRVNVLSHPRIQTSHAVPATLFIGDTIPYITGTSFGDLNGTSRSQYTEKHVGITLDVLPLINPDGLVVMDIQENIQQLGASVQIDGNPVPTTTERSAISKVAVRDRETIILGGFITTSKNNSKSGVPYLKDIPGLGVLFRSSSVENRRVELIILLRPTVLPSPESAALVAATERDKLSGIKQAEYEIREMERKRQEKIEADMRKKMGIKERSY